MCAYVCMCEMEEQFAELSKRKTKTNEVLCMIILKDRFHVSRSTTCKTELSGDVMQLTTTMLQLIHSYQLVDITKPAMHHLVDIMPSQKAWKNVTFVDGCFFSSFK